MASVLIGQYIHFFFLAVRQPRTVVAFPVGRAQAPDAQAQRPWLMGPAALRHVGSSRTGARTRVPCIGRRTLNHCATREAQYVHFDWWGINCAVWVVYYYLYHPRV